MEINPETYQQEIYRKMTPAEKYSVIMGLINSARELKAAYFRSLHPDWTDEEVAKALRDWFLNART